MTIIETPGREAARPQPDTVLAVRDVTVRRGLATVLGPLDWAVGADERWIVLGANGSGKTTLAQVASMRLHPTTGTVDLLGERLGQTDVRTLRRRVGLTSASLAAELRPALLARDVVMTARYDALEPWWHTYDDADRQRATELLETMGCGALVDREVGSCSAGERQRILVARALMNDPAVLLLDEPTAALDLGGREALLRRLSALADTPGAPATVLVTHHVEEIPAGFTHVLLLAGGEVLAAGPLEATLTAETLSACFGVSVELERRHDRWWAVAR